MKKAACLIIVILAVLTGEAQNSKIDSLKLLLQLTKSDTARISKLIQVGSVYRDIKNDSALVFYYKALQMSQKNGFKNGEIRARRGIANFMGSVKSDYATAMDLYLQNLKEEEKTGDTVSIFFDTRDVAVIYEKTGDFDKAMEYLNKLKILVNSGRVKDSTKLTNYRTIIDNRLGSLYESQNKLDSAKYYKFRAYNHGLAKNDFQWIALGSSGLGKVFSSMKNSDSAIFYYHTGISAALKVNRKDLYGVCLVGLGMEFMKIHQSDSAFYYGKKAFNHAQKEKSAEQTINASALLAEIYYINKQPDSAYKYLNQSVLLNDSLFSDEKITRIQNLGLNETLKNIQEEQTKKEAVQEYKSRIEIYSLVAGLAVLFIIIFIMYRNNNQRQKANMKIEKAYADLKATQFQLIQAEKMASLGELTAGIAHEIQNPLNFVNNFSEVNSELIAEMKDEIDKGNLEEVRFLANDIAENEQKINHHGKRADAIVKGMLQHSRSSSGIKEPTDINALADEYLRLAYHGLRAKDKTFNAILKTDFDEAIGKIDIIAQDIGRVILNLITNAFYAVDEKKKQNSEGYEPTVSISTIHSLSGEGRGEVLISVKDNGNGIPQKVLDKIFQPFFTTKPAGQGTGLGLSMSYDIVKAHGGELIVETKEGEFTSFIVRLPV